MMNRLRNFMYGRYGSDRLNNVIIFTSLGLNIVSLFLRSVPTAYYIVWLLSLALLGFGIFRMFSKNISARQNELRRYLSFESRLRGWWGSVFSKKGNVVDMNERRNYKHFSCPQCGQRLRVPRGKGKLRITCAKCGLKFEIKS